MALVLDTIMVSAERVKDCQLHAGDPVTLRLRDERTQSLTKVTFHYGGIVKEFPTAPKDSFFVTNADYVAQMTANPTVGAFLITGDNTAAPQLASRLRDVARPGTVITDGCGTWHASGCRPAPPSARSSSTLRRVTTSNARPSSKPSSPK
ncbi:hypothetical protein [Frankia sp. Cppng1_Ct_nod]|uniref:hypothetical protein n=1 Tax=Frankia sp. Cppng1_Ct_nod TaxID=2897162 RepID=UPI001040E6E5|nr:hypothetical protein [Frankia sp. Cppng1_Ct_nod]